jgi:hypothetical protein
MKKAILIFSFSLFCNTVFTQNITDFLVIKTEVLNNSTNLTVNQVGKLKNRIVQISSNYGYTAVEKNHDFVISSNIQIYDENMVDGLKKLRTIDGEVFISIYNSSSKVVYSSLTLKIFGTGQSRNTAVINAIRGIPTKNSQLENLFKVGKQKIYDYYTSNCNAVIARSNTDFSLNNYSEVLLDLISIPAEISDCYTEAQVLLKKSYLALQEKNCNKLLILGKQKIALNDYGEALKILGYIDPSSNCFLEALGEINKVENEIDERTLRDWKLRVQKYKNEIELEKYRLDAIKEIGKAYYTDESTNYVLDLIIIK